MIGILLNVFLGAFIAGNIVLVDFAKTKKLTNWMVVDDTVMGGRSQGNLILNDEKHAVFYGDVSLANNGGFSSIRHNFSPIEVAGYTQAKLRIKGDGKRYQFRVKSSRSDWHSYVYNFTTSGKWEVITIPITEMVPRFRGRNVNLPNYPAKVLAELSILISNKKAESFSLEIDQIILE